MYANPGIWPYSRLAFSEEDFEPSSVTPMEKEPCNLENSVSSANTVLHTGNFWD